jgi:hypothetical protein
MQSDSHDPSGDDSGEAHVHFGYSMGVHIHFSTIVITTLLKNHEKWFLKSPRAHHLRWRLRNGGSTSKS